MKLNGWQRLWVVVSTMYMVVLALFVVPDFPTPSKILHRAQFYDELPQESLARLIRADASSTPSTGTGRNLSYELFCDDSRDVVLAANNHKLCFRSDVTETERTMITQQYNALLKRATRSERLGRLGYMFLVWVVPCVVLYGVGTATGWVLRGFRHS
jgi:hypothetical protein